MKILNKVSSSVDETIKYQLSTSDGLVIEACVIFFFEEIAKINICVSSQVGCMFCINYLLFDGINDTIDDARRLIKFCKSLNAYIKISEYCPIKHSSLKPSKNFYKFVGILDDEHITWKSFQSKGADIKASCGHLLSEIEF